jgi:ubiquinone/menaquinone biosynthesis C-methylase UbiE
MAELSHHESRKKLSDSNNEFFNEQWCLYQKVLSNNYMGHREIYDILHEFLLSYYKKPFKMLDLGCGDASFAAQALLNTTMNFYCGIDLSEPALEIARDNMAKLKSAKLFIQGDFLELIFQLGQNPENSFDAIFSSFALHHLSLEQKDYLMGQLPRLLKTDGVFLLIDVVRSSEETREDYIRRYLENVRQDWSLLTPQEFLRVEEHISSSDFPETQEILYSLAKKHGFSRVDCLYRDPLDTTQLLCFYGGEINNLDKTYPKTKT